MRLNVNCGKGENNAPRLQSNRKVERLMQMPLSSVGLKTSWKQNRNGNQEKQKRLTAKISGTFSILR